MAFYQQAIEAMAPRMEAAVAGATSFGERIAGIMAVKFECLRPNRSFLGTLLWHTADPQNRLSPFSEATRQIRERDQMYFARAIATKSRGPRVPTEAIRISVSHIGEGVSPDYLRRLWTALNHAAAPNAIVVARTFSEPGLNTVANWAPLDRSSLWEAVEVNRTTELCAGG